jgi:hypothetical protein
MFRYKIDAFRSTDIEQETLNKNRHRPKHQQSNRSALQKKSLIEIPEQTIKKPLTPAKTCEKKRLCRAAKEARELFESRLEGSLINHAQLLADARIRHHAATQHPRDPKTTTRTLARRRPRN